MPTLGLRYRAQRFPIHHVRVSVEDSSTPLTPVTTCSENMARQNCCQRNSVENKNSEPTSMVPTDQSRAQLNASIHNIRAKGYKRSMLEYPTTPSADDEVNATESFWFQSDQASLAFMPPSLKNQQVYELKSTKDDIGTTRFSCINNSATVSRPPSHFIHPDTRTTSKCRTESNNAANIYHRISHSGAPTTFLPSHAYDNEKRTYGFDAQSLPNDIGSFDGTHNTVETQTSQHAPGDERAIERNRGGQKSHSERGISLRRRSHVSLRNVQGFSLPKSHKRQPIARD
ncbi:hypothetical protein BGZ63DRAFT_418844 [Mariannaea sp. PMI_226]|nr:hypothetical protein BGZ63DRAFT_418844 [Mariannaea sp. PMI_226]